MFDGHGEWFYYTDREFDWGDDDFKYDTPFFTRHDAEKSFYINHIVKDEYLGGDFRKVVGLVIDQKKKKVYEVTLPRVKCQELYRDPGQGYLFKYREVYPETIYDEYGEVVRFKY